jgi:Skp family chaperone for outer membrane proteins
MLIKTKIEKADNAKIRVEEENRNYKNISQKREGNTGFAKVALCGIYVIAGIFGWYMWNLEHRFSAYENNVAKMETKLAQRVDDNRKIYVYNMEEALKMVGVPESSQKFENDIASLEKEVQEAQEKIKTLKEAQVKEEFSEMYLRSLQMKRDELINKYSESMQATLDKINKALEDVARENSVHTIFMSNSIAVNTEYVVDITAQVVEKMQQQ